MNQQKNLLAEEENLMGFVTGLMNTLMKMPPHERGGATIRAIYLKGRDGQPDNLTFKITY